MLMMKAISMMKTFRKEEDGLALTEYLVLLGLLVGGVIGAVTAFGNEDGLAGAWQAWADWVSALGGTPS